jgi:hypothetical protein
MSNLSHEDPEKVYSQLTDEQRAVIAQEFLKGFQQSGNPKAQQFAGIDPNTVTPQQLAAMHQHAREEHPGLLGNVMKHPLVTALIGAFAAYEIEKHVTHRS